ncbi:unnamed protein product [Adineta steineri]|uniref:Uncharacterized protein n=1 Tax=Adineta steineri TaxID=433720 RepID=A0A818R1J3_9BILA|nr:unnamed protein product [Adineta steineri]
MLIFYNYDDYIYRDLYDDIYEITYVKDTSRRYYTIYDDPITYIRDSSPRYYTIYDEPVTYPIQFLSNSNSRIGPGIDWNWNWCIPNYYF